MQGSARSSAVEYMQRQLGEGKFLSKSLLATLDFEKGEIIALSPAPLGPEESVQFDSGHTPQRHAKPERIKISGAYYLAVPKANASEQLVEAIHAWLQSIENICILENYLAEAHDSWLQSAKSRVVSNGNEVYHVLLNADRDKKKIDAAIREWDHLPTSVGVLGSMAEKVSSQIGLVKVITTEQLTVFAQSARSVFVGAYDGEGYLVWNQSAR